MKIQESSFDDLLIETYKYILNNGESVQTSTRGDTLEVRNVILTLTNPRSRISISEMKSTIISCVGELLWYLSASDELKFIEYYIKDYKKHIKFKDDCNDPVPGAYGPRIFSSNNNQFEKVFEILSNSNNSRRAVISIYSTHDLMSNDSRDIPCTCTLQFFIRNNKLELTCHMRSNDAFIGLIHDIFCFTFIQEMMYVKLKASLTELKLGEYNHFVGSLHIYNENIEKINHYINLEGWQIKTEMNPIITNDINSEILKLLKIEKNIRLDLDTKIDQLNILTSEIFKEIGIILFAKYFVDRNDYLNLNLLKAKTSDLCISTFISKRIDLLSKKEKI